MAWGQLPFLNCIWLCNTYRSETFLLSEEAGATSQKHTWSREILKVCGISTELVFLVLTPTLKETKGKNLKQLCHKGHIIWGLSPFTISLNKQTRTNHIKKPQANWILSLERDLLKCIASPWSASFSRNHKEFLPAWFTELFLHIYDSASPIMYVEGIGMVG